MKKLILLVATAIITITVSAQQTINNFTATEHDVIWQKVYDTNEAPAHIIDYFNNIGFMNLDENKNGVLNFSIHKQPLNTKKHYSSWVTPEYLTFPITARVIIEIKDNRYRVTVSNILFFSTNTITLGGIIHDPKQESLSEYAYNYKRNKFKSLFKDSTSEMLDTIFSDMFEIHNTNNINNNDW